MTRPGHHTPVAGLLGAVSGAVALAAAAWVGVLTFSSVDPPALVRAAGSTLLPIGAVGAVVAVLVHRRDASRRWAKLGLAMAAAAVAVLVVMVALVDR